MKVLAALSGGVDSALAAALAVEAGHEVTGVHMALSAEAPSCRTGSRGCCSLEDSDDARRVCAHLSIPYYVWDLAENFKQRVIADFLSEYRQGRTPNPCLRCNEQIKFAELSRRALALGFDAVCTGHYARLTEGPAGLELRRARDQLKDQSYVLAVMPRAELSRCLFPLGDFESKAAVRQAAAERGLVVSQKPDSYDICFIPDGDTAGFLRRNLGEQPGQILDAGGQVLGEHRGYYSYTVGQRKGLNIRRPATDGRPRYVLAIDPQQNTVTVGAREELAVNTIRTGPPSWLAAPEEIEGLLAGGDLAVQLRAHGQALPARIEHLSGGPEGEGTAKGLAAHVGEEVSGVAAGQSLVVYSQDRVLGQATIASASLD